MNSFEAKNALVVGGSGFLGRTISTNLLSKGYSTWATYHNSPNNIPTGCHPVPFSSIEGLTKGFDVVYIAVGNHALPDKQLLRLNVDLPQLIMNQFPDSRIVYISSVAIYGNTRNIISEDSPTINPTFYGQTKLEGENVTKAHTSYAIVRPTYLYGVSMPTNSFLPAIIKRAVESREVTLFGKGRRLQDYLHINDVAKLCVKAGEHNSNDVFLAATGLSLSNLEVAEKVKVTIPSLEIKFSGIDSAPSFRFDSSITQSKLNWAPEESFDKILTEMVKTHAPINL